mgnify:CR=1 FL=1
MNIKAPRVCVLLAAYEGAKYIDKQLDSILCQNNVNIQLYISVDLSGDNTLRIVKDFALKFKNKVFILPYGERFGGAAPNFIRLLHDVDFSDVDYVSFADQDDIWVSDKLITACKCLDGSEYDAYSSNVLAFWSGGRTAMIEKSQPQVKYDYLFESSGPGCTYVFKVKLATVFKEKIESDHNVSSQVWMHDWFFYSLARHLGFNWFIDKKPGLFYRQHEGNVVGANSGWRSLFTRAKVILSGDGFNKVLSQSALIGQEELLPIQLIRQRNRISFLRLAFISRSCRRKGLDQLYFFVICIIFAIRGYKV